MKATRRFATMLGLGLGLCLPQLAQINNTLYFMHGVPQANRINPAHQPKCGFYLGFPMVAPLRVEFSSSSLGYGDIIQMHPSADSLITFLHPLSDKQAFLDELSPVNYVLSDFATSLGSVGFLTPAGFFSVDITSRMEGDLYYPKDLARLALYGTDDGETFVLDGIGADIALFDEISAGWSYRIMDNMQVGARAKLLFGIVNLNRSKSELSLTTSRDSWRVQSDMAIRASVPFGEVVYDADAMVEDFVLHTDLENFDPWAVPRYLFNFSNLGMGLDLGVNYRPIQQLQVSASVTDLGFINWKDEVHEVTYKADYQFDGVEYNPFEFSDDYTFGDYLDSTFSRMGDSLAGFLEFTQGGTYASRLNTKLFVGASYYLTPRINFGLLSRTDFLHGRIAQQVTATANVTTGRFINATLSYSYMNAYLKNIGLGLSFNVGPLNLYLISDNALNLVFWPHEARSANLWMGMNLVFGYRQFQQAEFRDRPLVY